MIIGNGDIAKALKEVDRDDLLFFASGVSNSQEKRESEYKREFNLLNSLLINPGGKLKHLVYFSSLAIFYSDTRYAVHKRTMELAIKERFWHYTIIRLGNISWGDNQHTIINFLRNKIKNGEPYKIKDEYRYIIEEDEFLHWMRLIPVWNCEMNIPGKMMKVKEIVQGLEEALKLGYCAEEDDEEGIGYEHA